MQSKLHKTIFSKILITNLIMMMVMGNEMSNIMMWSMTVIDHSDFHFKVASKGDAEFAEVFRKNISYYTTVVTTF